MVKKSHIRDLLLKLLSNGEVTVEQVMETSKIDREKALEFLQSIENKLFKFVVGRKGYSSRIELRYE